jgi:hypothetical protein
MGAVNEKLINSWKETGIGGRMILKLDLTYTDGLW